MSLDPERVALVLGLMVVGLGLVLAGLAPAGAHTWPYTAVTITGAMVAWTSVVRSRQRRKAAEQPTPAGDETEDPGEH